MLTLRRGYVGTAPGTTTLYMPLGDEVVENMGPDTLSYEQYLARDIALRQQQLESERKGRIWSAIGTIATTSVTTLALLAAVSAWARTGHLKPPTR